MDKTSISLLTFILFLSAVYDLRTYRIPNLLTYSSMFIGILYNIALKGVDGFFFSFGGIGVGIGILITFYFIGVMGAGDVKLLGVVGSFLGVKGVIGSFIFTGIAGGLYSIILIMVFRNKFRGVFSNLYYSGVNLILTRKFEGFGSNDTDNRPRLCYGLAIAAGTWIYMFCKSLNIEILPI